MEKYSFESDMPAAIEVIRHAGAWMRDIGLANYSDWWNPDKVNVEMLRPYAKPDEFFVLKVDGVPAAAVIIQSKQNLQDWSSVDKTKQPPQSTYVHYIAVERAFSGRGLVAKIMEKAEEIARKNESIVIRLDTNADEPKLCSLYEGLGFLRVGTDQEGSHSTAFYEKPIVMKS